MKKIVKKEEISKLMGMSAYERSRCKMDFYSRQEQGGQWLDWKFMGHSLPPASDYEVEMTDKGVFLVREAQNGEGEERMERYRLTLPCDEVLHVI